MSQIVYLNGSYRPKSEAHLSVDDRGFLFGDGVYEVTRAVDGRLFEGGRHFARLADGLRELRIAGTREAEGRGMQEISERLLAENDLQSGEAIVYIQVTRGAAPRAHQFPPSGTPPTVYAFAQRFTPDREQRDRGAAAITMPDQRWARCDLKVVNLVANVFAKQRAVEEGALEAILIRDGAVTEGSHTSVFAVLDGELRTYPLSNYILPSITRAVVLELAAELGLRARERPVFAAELAEVDELFVAGTTTDVTPIVTLDGRPVADGRPGRMTQALQEALNGRLYQGRRAPASVAS